MNGRNKKCTGHVTYLDHQSYGFDQFIGTGGFDRRCKYFAGVCLDPHKDDTPTFFSQGKKGKVGLHKQGGSKAGGCRLFPPFRVTEKTDVRSCKKKTSLSLQRDREESVDLTELMSQQEGLGDKVDVLGLHAQPFAPATHLLFGRTSQMGVDVLMTLFHQLLSHLKKG